jgi:hypothetical protein
MACEPKLKAEAWFCWGAVCIEAANKCVWGWALNNACFGAWFWGYEKLLAVKFVFWPKVRVLAGGAGWLEDWEIEKTGTFPAF